MHQTIRLFSAVFFLLSCSVAKLRALPNVYNGLVDKAEIAFIRGDCKEALLYYDKAFARNQYPFAQDLYNAVVCALHTSKNTRALRWCFLLAGKGTGADFFSKKAIFTPLKKERKWDELIYYANQAKIAIQQRYKEANDFLNGLYRLSDAIPFWDHTPDMQSQAEGDRLWKNDSLSQQLLKFIQDKGYPSEEMIGVYISRDTILEKHPAFYRLIEKRWPLFNSYVDSLFKVALLEKGVQQGLLKADIYCHMTARGLDWQRGAEQRVYYSWYGCSIYANKYIERGEVAQFRRSIGACSLDDYLKKLTFMIQYPQTDFSINTIGIRQDIPGTTNALENARYAKDFDLIVSDIPGCR